MTNSVPQLDGIFKEVYANTLDTLYPDMTEIADSLDFVTDEAREGNKYHQPVVLAREQGWTLSGAGGTAFTLNASEAATSKDAQINGAEFVLRATISYGAASRALKEQNKGRRNRAFVKATSYVLENMLETASWVREMELVYGGGTGTDSPGIGTINARTNDSGTTQTFSITDATWADGIWAGFENGFVDIYPDDMSAKRNTNGTIKVSAVNLDDKQITFVGTEAEMDTIAATDKVVLRGAKGNEMIGIETAIANSGTLWNIDASTYALWKASTSNASSGSLTFTKMLRAMNSPASRGLKSPFCWWVSNATWTDMMNDLSALRRYADSAKGDIEQGGSGLKFYGQTGELSIKPHPIIKNGSAFGYAPRYCNRVGSTDIAFQLPGQDNKNFFRELNDKAGYELRCYFNQAFFCRRMATMARITNIVNST